MELNTELLIELNNLANKQLPMPYELQTLEDVQRFEHLLDHAPAHTFAPKFYKEAKALVKSLKGSYTVATLPNVPPCIQRKEINEESPLQVLLYSPTKDLPKVTPEVLNKVGLNRLLECIFVSQPGELELGKAVADQVAMQAQKENRTKGTKQGGKIENVDVTKKTTRLLTYDEIHEFMKSSQHPTFSLPPNPEEEVDYLLDTFMNAPKDFLATLTAKSQQESVENEYPFQEPVKDLKAKDILTVYCTDTNESYVDFVQEQLPNGYYLMESGHILTPTLMPIFALTDEQVAEYKDIMLGKLGLDNTYIYEPYNLESFVAVLNTYYLTTLIDEMDRLTDALVDIRETNDLGNLKLDLSELILSFDKVYDELEDSELPENFEEELAKAQAAQEARHKEGNFNSSNVLDEPIPSDFIAYVNSLSLEELKEVLRTSTLFPDMKFMMENLPDEVIEQTLKNFLALLNDAEGDESFNELAGTPPIATTSMTELTPEEVEALLGKKCPKDGELNENGQDDTED